MLQLGWFLQVEKKEFVLSKQIKNYSPMMVSSIKTASKI